MAGRKPWDLTSTHALEGAAEWVRKRSGATAVLIVRGGDYACAAADEVRPEDAAEALKFVLEESAVEALALRRQQEREAAVRKRAAAIANNLQGARP